MIFREHLKCLQLIVKLLFSWHVLEILAAGSAPSQLPKFRITNTQLYVPVVTLLTQDNIKLLKQLKSGFKRTINRNKYHSKKRKKTQNRYLNVLFDPSFQGVNRLFVLWLEGNDGLKSYKFIICHLSK